MKNLNVKYINLAFECLNSNENSFGIYLEALKNQMLIIYLANARVNEKTLKIYVLWQFV